MLHNFIRNEMPVNIMEEKIDNDRIWDNVDKTQFSESIEPSNEWTI